MNVGRTLFGLVLVAVGVLLLLDQQGAVDAGSIIGTWWPTIFLVAAGLDLLSRPARRYSAAVFATIGIVLLAVTTGILATSVWQVLWPMAIIGLGLLLLFRGPRGRLGRATTDADTMDVVALFSGREVNTTASPFRGGSATAIFGGVEIELGHATIADGAILDATAIFGGVEVRVPHNVRVVLDGPAIFGGNDSKVPTPADPDAPVLRVRATALFGGVDVAMSRLPVLTT
jgi:predicted membrane protein